MTDTGVTWFTGDCSTTENDIDYVLGHNRTYRNLREPICDGPYGPGWFIEEWACLVKLDNGDIVAVLGSMVVWFKNNSSTFTADFGEDITFSLTHDSGSHEYEVTMQSGANVTTWRFHDFEQNTDPKGAMIEKVDPSDISTTVESYEGCKIKELIRSVTVDSGVGSDTTDFSQVYTYNSDQHITETLLRTRVNGGSWSDIEKANYTYYGAGESFGPPGALKSVERQENSPNPGWHCIAKSAYRYYKSGDAKGFEYGLKYFLGRESYSRMEQDGVDPLTASNTVVAGYAERYLEYDDDAGSDRYRSVVKDVSKNCASCGGGGGTGSTGETYGRTKKSGTPPVDYNAWKWKTVRTMGDGLQNIVYTNYIGQVMLMVVQNESDTSRRWLTFHKYDSGAREIMTAMPSAVTGYDESKSDLLDFNSGTGKYLYLRDNEGLIHVTDYYSSTTATTTTPGGVTGYVQFSKVKKGQSGTAIKLAETTYIKRTAGGRNVYPVAQQFSYPSESNQSLKIETSFAYTWYTGKTQIQQRTTTLPAISTTQHGDNTSATRKDYHDQYGNLTWQMDERGFITHFKYNVPTGRMIQRIDDVDTSVTSGAPSGWTTPSGGGLNLVTDYEYDFRGRQVQVLGPSHQVDLGGTATTVRRASWTVYKETCTGLDETWSGQGYLASGSYTLVNPVHISKLDKAGRTIDSISSKRTTGSGKLQSTDTFAQSDWCRWTHNYFSLAGQLEYTRTYHTIPTSGSGSPGTNYDESFFGYDPLNRLQIRVKTPGGTINRSVYDAIRRLDSGWVGTYDTPTGGAGWEDWSPTNNIGCNMVELSKNEYDSGSVGLDSNLTKVTQHVDHLTANDRVSTFTYDFRNRRLTSFSGTDGVESVFSKSEYDNLDRVVKTERYATDNNPGDGNLLARSETFFDDRSRVYETKTYAVDPTTGTVGNALVGGNWYDPASNVLKSVAPGAGVVYTKNEYDSLGRSIRTFVAYDDSGDVIIEESLTTFDNASNVLYVTSKQRNTDASTFRSTYTASWYDGVDRPIATAAYGTNGGSSFTRPTTTPTRSDDVLVTSTEYDSATGEAFKTTDPKALVTKREFDDAGRTIKVIENFVQNGTGADENRTTEFTYNADGNQTTITAVNPTTGNQVTTYIYGITTNDSALSSNLLLRAIQYPTDTATSRVELKYNRQGQVQERKDQAGTIHTYEYDRLGRQTQDRVIALGSGIDDAVLRIATAYEIRGMVLSINSYDDSDVGEGAIINAVLFEYNTFGQLISDYQSHAGPVDKGVTPRVQYQYASGNAQSNTIRPTVIIYPNGRIVEYVYSTVGSMNDKLNRIDEIRDVNGNL